MSRPAASASAVEPRLIVNADDWGRDLQTTDRIFDCTRCRAVSAVSAMVFMADSERAADLAVEHSIDAGLHLNLTEPFTAPTCPAELSIRQRAIARYLRSHRLAPVIFNPALRRSFAYVVAAQIDEYRRLYGADPARIDGHHHMHLCANVLLSRLMPSGTLVRRNFTFQPGEKSALNRGYRRLVDRLLQRRHRLQDCLFALTPLDRPGRLERLIAMARSHVVEIETHPVQPDEFSFLTGGAFFRLAEGTAIGPHTAVAWSRSQAR